MKKISIVIPTYNHAEDLLAPCIESINKYTDPKDVEVIIVANGCKDNTREVATRLKLDYSLLWYDEAIGYTKATNKGIEHAKGDYIVLLNNDTILLDQPKNQWLEMLLEPFKDDRNVGITGPMLALSPESNRQFLIFFCVMIKKKLFKEIGLLDEIFNPGFGEDIAFCHNAEDVGYKIVQVPGKHLELRYNEKIMIGTFPIYHAGEKTFEKLDNCNELFIRNSNILKEKYGNKSSMFRPIKLNLGCGDMILEGYDNIDLYNEKDGIIKMDIRNLNYQDNSVDEIMCVHAFEHLSPYDVYNTLKEWYRVLKPYGKLIIELPDILGICQEFITADKTKRYELLNCIYGTTQINHPHLFGWYDEILIDHLKTAGFSLCCRKPTQYTNHWGSNMKIECTKYDQSSLPDGFFGDVDISCYRDMFESLPNQARIVEVGCFKGRSICSVADIIKKKNITCSLIDNYKFDYNDHLLNERVEENMPLLLDKNLTDHGLESNVFFTQNDSIQESKMHVDQHADLIFIDANHEYEAVKADIEAWYPKVKSGGILAGHDLVYAGVRRAVEEKFHGMIQYYPNIWVVRKPKVFDCFIFYNELDVLEIRLNELNDVVDHFVIVEATKTFVDKEKPLYFKDNIDRFSKFKNKIIHYVVDDLPDGVGYDANWDRERHQRDCIMRALNGIATDNDVIIISDVDEIPSPNSIKQFSPVMGMCSIEQDLYYYRLNLKANQTWDWCKILPYGIAKQMTPCQIRYTPSLNKIRGGWHFSFLGQVDHIMNKISSYAHAEFNVPDINNINHINECISKGTDIFNRPITYNYTSIDESYPSYILNNLVKYIDKGFIN